MRKAAKTAPRIFITHCNEDQYFQKSKLTIEDIFQKRIATLKSSSVLKSFPLVVPHMMLLLMKLTSMVRSSGQEKSLFLGFSENLELFQ